MFYCRFFTRNCRQFSSYYIMLVNALPASLLMYHPEDLIMGSRQIVFRHLFRRNPAPVRRQFACLFCYRLTNSHLPYLVRKNVFYLLNRTGNFFDFNPNPCQHLF